MALTANVARPYELGDINELPVAASSTIYEGSVVGDNASGYAQALTAGDPFRGFAEEKVDNSDGSAGDLNVRVKTRGKVQLSVSGLAITDVDAKIYASDDGTFTKTKSTNTLIGTVYRYISSGVGIIDFDATAEAKLALDVIDGTMIEDDAIDSEHYAALSIDTGHIALDAIDGTLIADDAIDSEHYAALSIDTGHIALDAIDGTLIADDAVSLEHLDAGITPAYVVKYAGEFTTVGGDATETITVTGALATDIALVTLHTATGTARTILTAVAIENAITVTMSDDPSTTHVLSYMLLRAVV